jgi:hypothetical protein
MLFGGGLWAGVGIASSVPIGFVCSNPEKSLKMRLAACALPSRTYQLSIDALLSSRRIVVGEWKVMASQDRRIRQAD